MGQEYYPIFYDQSAPYPNPNNVWEVGYSGSLRNLPTDFVAYNVSGTLYGPDMPLQCLYTDRGDVPNFCQNTGDFPVKGIEPRQVALHPFAGAYSYSILRFYAPKAATYEVDTKFFSGESGESVASIYRVGTLVVDLGPVPTNYTFTTYLMPGQFIDIVVGPGRDGISNDTTPLEVLIRDVRCIGWTG